MLRYVGHFKKQFFVQSNQRTILLKKHVRNISIQNISKCSRIGIVSKKKLLPFNTSFQCSNTVSSFSSLRRLYSDSTHESSKQSQVHNDPLIVFPVEDNKILDGLNLDPNVKRLLSFMLSLEPFSSKTAPSFDQKFPNFSKSPWYNKVNFLVSPYTGDLSFLLIQDREKTKEVEEAVQKTLEKPGIIYCMINGPGFGKTSASLDALRQYWGLYFESTDGMIATSYDIVHYQRQVDILYDQKEPNIDGVMRQNLWTMIGVRCLALLILHIKGQVKKPSDWADLQFDGISEYCMKVQKQFGKYRINEPTFMLILEALCSRLQIPKLPVFLDEAHVLLKTKELFLIPQEAGKPDKHRSLFHFTVRNIWQMPQLALFLSGTTFGLSHQARVASALKKFEQVAQVLSIVDFPVPSADRIRAMLTNWFDLSGVDPDLIQEICDSLGGTRYRFVMDFLAFFIKSVESSRFAFLSNGKTATKSDELRHAFITWAADCTRQDEDRLRKWINENPTIKDGDKAIMKPLTTIQALVLSGRTGQPLVIANGMELNFVSSGIARVVSLPETSKLRSAQYICTEKMQLYALERVLAGYGLDPFSLVDDYLKNSNLTLAPQSVGDPFASFFLTQFMKRDTLWDIPLFERFRTDPSCPKWLTSRPMTLSVTHKLRKKLPEALEYLQKLVIENPLATSTTAFTFDDKAGPDGLLLSSGVLISFGMKFYEDLPLDQADKNVIRSNLHYSYLYPKLKHKDNKDPSQRARSYDLYFEPHLKPAVDKVQQIMKSFPYQIVVSCEFGRFDGQPFYMTAKDPNTLIVTVNGANAHLVLQDLVPLFSNVEAMINAAASKLQYRVPATVSDLPVSLLKKSDSVALKSQLTVSQLKEAIRKYNVTPKRLKADLLEQLKELEEAATSESSKTNLN